MTAAGSGAGAISHKTLVLNSAAAFIGAQMLVVLVHELAHVVAGLALGSSGELFPFGVVHTPEGTRGQAAVMALAGPLFSLVTGAVMVLWQPLRSRRGFAQLFWVWFAHVSVMEGIGYLVLTPFGVGDTGATAASYDLSPVITWLCLLISVAGMFWLAMSFARAAVVHTAGDLPGARGFAFHPWIPGVVFAVLLQLLIFALVEATFSPGEQVAVMMASVALGVFAPMSVPFSQRIARRDASLPGSARLQLRPIPVAGLVVIAVLLVIDLVVLTPGLQLG